MRTWVGLLLFALAFVAGSFGVAILAAEWRHDDVADLSDDVTALKAEVEDFREGIRELTEALEPPTPTPTPEPMTVAARVRTTIELRGMRLTVRSATPQVRAGNVEFQLENIEAPTESARPDVFLWRAADTEGVACAVRLSGTIAPVAPGEKVIFAVNWSCRSLPAPAVIVDNLILSLPAP